MKEKIIIQEKVKSSSSGSTIYVLIPKNIREELGITKNSMSRLEFDPKTKELSLKFLNEGEKIGKKG